MVFGEALDARQFCELETYDSKQGAHSRP
jgi:hypothetical protein